MSVDAVFTIEGEIDKETLEVLSNQLEVRGLLVDYASLKIKDYGAELMTGERWYSKDYPGGDWMRIYTTIKIIQHLFPKCHVYYYPDYSSDSPVVEWGDPITDFELQEIWQHYVTTNGMPKMYRSQQPTRKIIKEQQK